MSLAKLKTPHIVYVKTLNKKWSLPRAGVGKTTSHAFRAEERKGLVTDFSKSVRLAFSLKRGKG